MAFTEQDGFLRDTPASGAGHGALVVTTTSGSNAVEIANDSGNPIPVSKDTTANSASNPIFVDTEFDKASATTQSATTIANATQVAQAGNWTAVHFPATATQATASKGAGATGVRHIATSITVSFAQPTASPVAFTGDVALRDGLTGAGTVLWRAAIACPATASEVRTITISGLAIVGSAATAMTLEFNAAGGTATQQSVTLTGYSVI